MENGETRKRTICNLLIFDKGADVLRKGKDNLFNK